MSHEAEETAQKLQQDGQQQLPPPPPPPPLPTLPSPRVFLTELLSSLPGRTCIRRDDGRGGVTAREADASTGTTTPTRAPAGAGSTNAANPLRALQGNDRNVFLTLHVLFPNELLPALDLLDRGLVTRFVVVVVVVPAAAACTQTQTQTQTQTAPRQAAGGTVGASAIPGNGDAAASNRQEEGEAAVWVTSSCIETSNTVGVSDADGGGSGSGSSNRGGGRATINTTAIAHATASTPQPPAGGDPASRRPGPDAAGAASKPAAEERPARVAPTLYYVRSAQQAQQQYHHNRSRYGHSHHDDEGDAGAPSSLSVYEVRLAAWNCSCPAFAFAAFPPNLQEPSPEPPEQYQDGGASHAAAARAADAGSEYATQTAEDDVSGNFSFGGLRIGGAKGQVPPVCKHLLACLLVERASGLFGGCVKEKVVSVEEAAAWAAGWGG